MKIRKKISFVSARFDVASNCVIESNSIVAAGAVVIQNTIVESGTIYAGIPAKKVKDISQSDFAGEIE